MRYINYKMEQLQIRFTERELLTLREGLYLFKASEYNNLSEYEFNILDTKIKSVFKEVTFEDD